MPASTLSGRSVALLRVNLDDYTSEGRSISHGNYTTTNWPSAILGFRDEVPDLVPDFASSYDHYENFPDRFETGYRLQLEAFFAALREGRTPTPGPQDALKTIRLAVAATKSWHEKRSVKDKWSPLAQ